jgi:hypothetical protein
MKASPPAFIIKIEQRHSGQILDKLSFGISIYKNFSFCLDDQAGKGGGAYV